MLIRRSRGVADELDDTADLASSSLIARDTTDAFPPVPVMPGMATPPRPNTGCGVVTWVLCSNCVGSCASCWGACLFRRGPVARPPMKAARDMGSAEDRPGVEADPFRVWLSPMSFRSASSWLSCLSGELRGVLDRGGEVGVLSFKLFATSVLAVFRTWPAWVGESN